MVDVASVTDIDPACLSHEERILALEALQLARNAVDVAEQRVLAALAASDSSEQEWVRDEIALVLQIAPVTASAKLHDASDLIHLLPLTFEHLLDSTIGIRHARVMLEHVRRLDDGARAAVERRVMTRAAGKTVSEFRRAVRRAVAALDPRRSEERHADAMTERRVVLTPQDDGMSELWALLPADGAATLMATITGYAAHLDDPDDTRTADQKRADVLVALGALAAQGHHDANQPGGIAASHLAGPRHGPRVQVTVALTTLLDLDDQPGELAGHGPVPASMARRIAADPTGTWQRILTNSTGRLLAVSRAYRPPPRLADLVTARDRTCRFPGCQRAAARCELDHIRPHSAGGATAAHNLHALCRRHHHLKHEAPGWRVARASDGDTQWRSPSGRTYLKPGDPYPPDPHPELFAS